MKVTRCFCQTHTCEHICDCLLIILKIRRVRLRGKPKVEIREPNDIQNVPFVKSHNSRNGISVSCKLCKAKSHFTPHLSPQPHVSVFLLWKILSISIYRSTTAINYRRCDYTINKVNMEHVPDSKSNSCVSWTKMQNDGYKKPAYLDDVAQFFSLLLRPLEPGSTYLQLTSQQPLVAV